VTWMRVGTLLNELVSDIAGHHMWVIIMAVAVVVVVVGTGLGNRIHDSDDDGHCRIPRLSRPCPRIAF
jgi:hypothetical protein